MIARGWAADRISIAAFFALSLLPLLAIAARKLGLDGIPGSPMLVQHLTLWIAMLGACLAARSGRLLTLSTTAFLPEKWRPAAAVFAGAATAAISLCLAWASFDLVRVEREAGAFLVGHVPLSIAEAIMPVGFAVIALRSVWAASPRWPGRLIAATGLLLPPLLNAFSPSPGASFPHMAWAGSALILVATIVGLPVFATLGGLALLLFWASGVPVAAVAVEAYRLVASPLLPSIPLFTLAGYLLAEGGASRRLLRVFTALFGWLPGGLAIVTAAVCAFFTITGSGVTILSLGGLMLPVLVKARYPEGFSIGLLTASGSLGLLFPPSLPVILYGVYAQTPIDSLFIAGFIPGLLMVALASAWGVRQAILSRAGQAVFSWREAGASVWEAKWELGLPVVVLIGLFGGFATLVETAAMTVLYSFVVEYFLYRDLTSGRDYGRVAVECATVVGGVLIILGVAMGFTNYLVQAEVPALLFAWVREHVHSRWLFLLLLNVFLLIVGCLMDIFAAIIVVVPLITPMGAAFGIDPIQLGIIFLANLELGYLTPPVGMNLFLAAYRFEQPVSRVVRASFPFLLILLAAVLVITYVPALTLAPLRWLGR